MAASLKCDDARGQAGNVGKAENKHPDHIPPVVTGQCAQVLNLISRFQPMLSFRLTADYAIPEAAARVHDLRGMGFNVLTTILPEVEFRGAIRRNAAMYSLGSPKWPAPGYFDDGPTTGQIELDLGQEAA